MGLGARRWAYLIALAPLAASFVHHGRRPPVADLVSDALVGVTIACLVTVLLAQQRRLLETAATDALTGCYTARRFVEELPLAVARAQRGGRPLTLMYLDLDNFKQVNDRHGHGKGNEVLTHFARCVKACIRTRVDLPFRVGGDEFAVILTDAKSSAAQIVGERLRNAISAEPHSLRALGVTVSIGAVELRDGESSEQFTARADAAMYDAKRGGKDRVRTA